jgi:hypothetical protein
LAIGSNKEEEEAGRRVLLLFCGEGEYIELETMHLQHQLQRHHGDLMPTVTTSTVCNSCWTLI